MLHPGYPTAFLDWLACAWGGRNEPAVVAARTAGDPVLVAGTAGHVLDFDDTYAPGLSHLSAPTAPAALVIGAQEGATIAEVLEAYSVGFAAMAGLARASHPALYENGWHATAVTGTVGAAVAAARILRLDEARIATARHLAVLGAGGLRAAFGTDGKSLQVGMAASQGVQAARLAAAGATAPGSVGDAFATAYGGTWAEPDPEAITDNWIKAFPCCLQTHSAIEAGLRASDSDLDLTAPGVVTVHPRSRQAAPYDEVDTGLAAKFSIPYTTAFALLRGVPTVDDFLAIDPGVRTLAARIRVELDGTLDESEAVLRWPEPRPLEVRVGAARGSPAAPMTADQLSAKVVSLAGDRLEDILDDPSRPASDILDRIDLS